MATMEKICLYLKENVPRGYNIPVNLKIYMFSQCNNERPSCVELIFVDLLFLLTGEGLSRKKKKKSSVSPLKLDLMKSFPICL